MMMMIFSLVAGQTLAQAPTCGTVYHRTYDKSWTSRVSSVNW